jgi:TatD DNase family protein
MMLSSIPITLIDTHCHLDYILEGEHGHEPTDTPNAILEEAARYGVCSLINPSVTPHRFEPVLRWANQYPSVYAALATHPCHVDELEDLPDWETQLTPHLENPKVVAIGETGLDYHWRHDDKAHQARQRRALLQHLKLAETYKLPIILHDREAHDDIHAMLQDFPTVTKVLHCFSGDAAFAETMLAEGAYLSFAGNVTFKKATHLQEAAKITPFSQLLVETDSPYLSPVPERGKPNLPYRTAHTAAFLAELKGVPYADFCQATTESALKAFPKLGIRLDSTR